jgi:hypothetical protein
VPFRFLIMHGAGAIYRPFHHLEFPLDLDSIFYVPPVFCLGVGMSPSHGLQESYYVQISSNKIHLQENYNQRN